MDELLGRFCAMAGITEELSPSEKKLFVKEITLAYRTFAGEALAYTTSYDSIELNAPVLAVSVAEPAPQEVAEDYAEVVQKYLAEGARSNHWGAKTVGEKEDALALLSEITGGKAVRLLRKADARAVKDVLMLLPRNRRKTAKTRDLSLQDMLRVQGTQIISPSTLNVYISNLQSFCKWAVDNGYAEVNVFEGMRMRITTRQKDTDRRAFTGDQLRQMFLHLTTNPAGLIKKDDHKWPVLIAMFSGMRLNEIAQLPPGDVRLVGEVWCFDVNMTGDSNKSLKNASSQRLVPIHQGLLDTGLLAFVQTRQDEKATRLFPSLTYSKQNGYGRNAGRWFNESFLPALGIGKGEGLMFHCLRHTMITQLTHREAPEAHIKAFVGHTQHGVTYTSYFKAGFLPKQLQRAMNLFSLH